MIKYERVNFNQVKLSTKFLFIQKNEIKIIESARSKRELVFNKSFSIIFIESLTVSFS